MSEVAHSAISIKYELISIWSRLQVEKWRQNDSIFHGIPVYCTFYEIDEDSVVTTQLTIFDRHLNQIAVKYDDLATAIASWLSRAQIETGAVEYKAKVFNSCEWTASFLFPNTVSAAITDGRLKHKLLALTDS